jgi:hypothetical protein
VKQALATVLSLLMYAGARESRVPSEFVGRTYGTGDVKEGHVSMGVDDMKAILKRVLADILGTHQANKAALTQETIDADEALKN